MRAMLIINPNATAMRRGSIDLLERAMAAHGAVTALCTASRGHATTLAARARRDEYDLVVAFGGDGTVNEVVQGLLSDPTRDDDTPLPLFAAMPGGYGNTFARNLGFPMGIRGSVKRLSEAIGEGRTRQIGLGFARSHGTLTTDGNRFRWVCFSAGLGFDAEIIRSIEQARNGGRKINGPRYVSTTVRHALVGYDRSHPRLTVRDPAGPPGRRAYMAVVQNTSPYAYVNRWHVTLAPRASFDTGLDLFSVYDMSLQSVLRTSLRAVRGTFASREGMRGNIALYHDLPLVHVESDSPVSLQIDGEGIGMVDHLECRSVPAALRVCV